MAIKVVKELTSVNDFEFWGGAKANIEGLTNKQLSELWSTMEGYFETSEYVEEGDVNDIFHYGFAQLWEDTYGLSYELMTQIGYKGHVDDFIGFLRGKRDVVIENLISYLEYTEMPTEGAVKAIVNNLIPEGNGVETSILFENKDGGETHWFLHIEAEFGGYLRLYHNYRRFKQGRTNRKAQKRTINQIYQND